MADRDDGSGKMACRVDIDNAITLGWDVSYNYSSNNAEKLSKVKTINLQLLAVDLNNATGIGDCISPLAELRTSRDYADIIVNSHNLGSGKLTSFNLEEGTFVNEGIATLTYEVTEDLENGVCWITGGATASGYYNGLPLSESLFTPKNLENISENFSFNSGNNGGSFTHSIDVQFNKSDNMVTDTSQGEGGSTNTALANIAKAQKIAKDIFESNSQPPFGTHALPQILQNPNLQTYYNENLDYINASCSFEKNYSSPSADGCLSGACATHNLSYSRRECFETVSIQGEIKGTEADGTTTKFQNAENLYNNTEDPALSGRLQAFFSRYKDAAGGALNDIERKCVTSNTFEGTIRYDAEASNDPKQQNQSQVNQSQTISYRTEYRDPQPAKKVVTVSETVSVQGQGTKQQPAGGKTTYPAYNNATTSYNTLLGGAGGRIDALYPAFAANNKKHFKEVSSSSKESPYQGSRSYTVTYSDDPDKKDPSKSIGAIETNINTIAAKTRYAISNPPNNPSIAEAKGQEKPRKTINISMRAGTGAPPGAKSYLDEMLQSGIDILDENAATCYINSINYNYGEDVNNGRSFSLNAEFIDS